ncbi:4-hydroxybenzoate octaprenyltransferase [Sodalis glossinidius str. 'morsitans']|uniref:4-hydroxybenzoate octaprenyltransferase n=3 Tax=Sodalis glossinidius TaxID=63612 RepID=UBIA_SODGM|nr:4-hydroxybenzoate octaprenyltransferase [Sodalis glossinidius]Q2NR07.1 RecName: Full=4-hydroxybenzoate octaprenyltransferase; AltName: Full=4-HB polyprenyltransferase [Sodalis glossinidius str. 'morsitans']BAE75418.1 4-hydroxybenzoate octaprenyltransferase [Sodalis glossinidius str. 'morsitans']CRL46470.1 4-hydroxybenzoate octaprenyltransferase [Sodalis glossinidius str. 'morsitans']
MDHSLTQDRWQAWCRLMRIDKPIGSLLLLWPTLWALWLAGMAIPALGTLTVFILGVFFMRAAGCVINDYADRKIDGHVKRTRARPLPSGAIGEKEAKLLFGALVGISFALVLTLNSMTIALSTVALALAWVYPFMKRYTHLPQLVLGAAFGWSIPMVFTAVSESLPLSCWLLFLANITWTVAYDTQYAMVDRDDDLRIGVKSTAILFGRFDKLIIGLLQLATLLLLGVIGWQLGLGRIYYLALAGAAGLFLWQQKLIVDREREACFRAFLNNNLVGMLIFVGILLSLLSY